MTSCHLWMQSDTCTCGPCHAAHFLGHHSSLPLCTPATPNAGGSSVTMVVPASALGSQTPAISLLSDADLVFSPFSGGGGGRSHSFCPFHFKYLEQPTLPPEMSLRINTAPSSRQRTHWQDASLSHRVQLVRGLHSFSPQLMVP